MSEINLGQVVGPKGDRGDTGLINGATQVQVDSTTKVMYNGSSIPANTAASRLVGTGAGQIPLAQNIYSAVGGTLSVANMGTTDVNTLELGTKSSIQSATNEPPAAYRAGSIQWCVDTFAVLSGSSGNREFQMAYGRGGNKAIAFRNMATGGYTEWVNIYTTANTKLDTNGAVSPSSPTIDLYSDRIEANIDGEKMNPEFVRNGVGDYTIKNTTGLRDEGWYIKIPNDMNGNPKVAVAIDTDKDGNLSIKTYRRIFSMETFIFIPDLETPLDIPEGRWIDLRFNDLPYKELDDTQTEV